MFVVLDLETSGLDIFSDSIIEIAILKVDFNYNILEKLNYLVNPGFEIDKFITEITGITNKDLKNAKKFSEIKDEIKNFIGNNPILGHNLLFDLNFLKEYGLDFTKNINIDTLYLSNFLIFDNKSLKLESLAIYFDLDINGNHRALKDTNLTLDVFKNLIKILKEISNEKLNIIYYFLKRSNDQGINFILKNLVKNKEKIKLDKTLFIKYTLKQSKKYKKNTILNLDKNFILDKDIFDIKGLEKRENQAFMSTIVDKTLTKKKLSIIEAPTGVGKTFAYLIPAIKYSTTEKKQIFISTTTKALQDQIYYKDLNFLRKKLNIDFSYTKLKGKNNYFSFYSFFDFLDKKDFFTIKELSFILKITFWLYKTDSFELDELDFMGEEYSFLREINADNLLVFNKQNPYYNLEPIIIARNNAKNSNIVIINNSILFKDIYNDNGILGKIENLILDEAHNLEEVVTDSLKQTFYYTDFEKNYNNIIFLLKKEKYNNLKKIEDEFEKINLNLQLFFDYCEDYVKKVNTEDLLIEDNFYKNKQNFLLDKLTKNLKNNFLLLTDLLNLLPDNLYLELNKNISFIDKVVDIIDKVLDKDTNNLIKIISISKYKGLSISYTLLKIGDFLDKHLWSKLESCILTSATFTISNTFDYFNNLLNLNKFEKHILKSDFDYKKQSLLFIPNDIGYIKNNILEIISFLKEFILIIKGQTLVLFRALSTIKEVFLGISKIAKINNINIYAQGVGISKHKLLLLYKKNYFNSILMGSDTFWEGIDLKNEELKYLIIHKIPFTPPNDPIFKARSLLFQDSFYKYSIPKAIIKLKQGFGRLIRTKTDSGIVIFLDNRVISSKWGNLILEAFPKEINIKINSKNSLFKVLKKIQN